MLMLGSSYLCQEGGSVCLYSCVLLATFQVEYCCIEECCRNISELGH